MMTSVSRLHIGNDLALQRLEGVVPKGGFENGFRGWHGEDYTFNKLSLSLVQWGYLHILEFTQKGFTSSRFNEDRDLCSSTEFAGWRRGTVN
jgi:hypothetical protein